MKHKDTILVVDDTQANIDILLEFLSDYDVIVALDGMSALDILKEENDIDLILLDVMMPKIDGFEVCSLIKKNKNISEIPIIFITAKTDEASIEMGFNVGGVDYIQKPFKPSELIARVKTQLYLQKNEKKLREYDKFVALGELMENIAHQWRQPLSAISVASSGMILQKEMGMLSDEQFFKGCNTITKHTQDLSQTLESLKWLLNNSIENTILDVDTFIEKFKKELFKDLEEKQITLNVKKGLKIKGSSEKLFIILRNIIQNSIDTFKENEQQNGQIIFEINQNETNIFIHIIDNGGGIKKEIMENIFEPYFTTKHQSQGKGLGLYTVYHLIKESFGGMINVHNSELEPIHTYQKGVDFEIILPSV